MCGRILTGAMNARPRQRSSATLSRLAREFPRSAAVVDCAGARQQNIPLATLLVASASTTEINMKTLGLLLKPTTIVCLCLIARAAAAADYPAPKEGDWIARDFRFHTGEVMPELRLHYTTVGAPSGQPVLILHGTTGSGAAMLSPAFAGELFGPASHWTRASTSSSCRTPSAPENRPNLPMACAPSFPDTITTTWSRRNTSW
jgi:hypothetical protein